MELFHTEVRNGITYKLFAEIDEIPVRGNAIASGDNEYDRRVETRILDRVGDGDVWAWAAVTVTAEIDGIDAVGKDHLGACSYASYKAFVRKGGYYDDMKQEAKDNLFARINDLVKAAKGVCA